MRTKRLRSLGPKHSYLERKLKKFRAYTVPFFNPMEFEIFLTETQSKISKPPESLSREATYGTRAKNFKNFCPLDPHGTRLLEKKSLQKLLSFKKH